MYFIRFAGCPVSRHGECYAWDGTPFACDTDVHLKESVSIDDLVERADTWKRICFTGGEPFLHSLAPLMHGLNERKRRVFHIETSGCLIPDIQAAGAWLTVSPKQGYLKYSLSRADEVKVLVGGKTDLDNLNLEFRDVAHKTYIQPVNFRDSWSINNLERCIEFVKEHPVYTLSTQLHKVIGVR
jgi:organic radical activating enzyme